MKLWWRESDGQSPRFVDAIAKKIQYFKKK